MDAATPRASPRTKDPERTRADILAVAREEFSAFGLSGARVDAIAERTRTSKRMIYYYFGSKEGLYLAVLEKAYADIRQVEADLDLGNLAPAEAIRRLVEFTFEYDEAHPDFIRLVTIENIHRAEHLSGSETIRGLNLGVIQTITDIIARGQADGCFRADVDPLDVHMMISALCFFRVSNRHTFGAIFSVDLDAPALRARHKRMIGDAVLGMLAIR
ncbi:TetR family transcriptional regulator [Methylobacterium nonmethylotrophicum]|uniref:TetR family transcriptional regulator n=1 Tax=Methylobacterium nonmethylotrophicum TaxID=1141884 RepID=A0A4Z0NU42_9HYPH|nr:TetR family transcriptional regulator [Methylobacterium nonmethylotrophicum]TGE00697.1 TetR family transcriptional regulator [Methylobacterium nonmethylotrophicum]